MFSGFKANVATLRVSFGDLEGRPILAGETVNGTVFLEVVQDTVSCVSIGCRVYGQESTTVHYTEHHGTGKNRRTVHKTAHERRNFMDNKFILQTFSMGQVSRGQYEFPFSFNLPSGVPSSMSAGGRDHCSVGYGMEVWLDRPGLLRWDIETKKHFAVKRAAPTSSKVPLYIEPSRIDVFTMCCFKRGGNLVGGYAESSLLHSGAATHVKYAAHNNSTATIKAIEVSLTELVAFRAQGHHSLSVTRLFHKRLGADETSLTLEKINAAEKDAVEDRIYRDLQHLGRTLEGETTRLDFTVPASARSSYNGSIIHVNHTFSIKVITTFGTANPMVTRDIQMYSTAASNSAPTDAETPSAPPAGGGGAWAPVVASAVVLPEMAVSKVATADVEHDNNQPIQYAVAATPSTQAGHYSDVAALVQAMQQTYDPCGEVDKYLRQGHRADDLQPEDLFNLFRVVTDGFDQQRLADTLAGQMRQLTCMKVARVAAGARAMFRREVVEKFLKAAPVSDPENAQLVKAELSAFEFMTVEKYFQGN